MWLIFFFFFFTFSDSNYSVAKNVKLDSFSRIIKGDSLRIDKMVPTETYPPARILDLSAFVIKGQKISKENGSDLNFSKERTKKKSDSV